MKFHHALNDAKLRGVKPKAKSFKLADGEGLHLKVMPAGKDGKPGGAMYWRYNYRVGAKAKTMALGTYPAITLKIARERHYTAAAIVQTGADPMAQRRVEKVQAEEQATAEITFGAMADQWLVTMAPVDKLAGKTNDRNERMVRYLKAAMGDVALPDLRVSHLADLLAKYEAAGKYETRVRIQGAAISIMDFAVGRGKIDQNPFSRVKFTAAFTAPANISRPAITDPEAFGHLLRKVQHFEGRDDNLTGYALELLTLTWPRPGDVAQAEWAQFDLDNAKWSIPFDRLKQRTQRTESKDDRAGLPHEVPLSRQAVALLRDLNRRTGNSRWLFPGRQEARTMSENTMGNALIALGYKDVHCPHGYRSSASTILNAQRITMGGRKVRRFEQAMIELQLDHNDDSTRAIYDRGGCWDERMELMQVWADLVDRMRAGKPTDSKAKLAA